MSQKTKNAPDKVNVQPNSHQGPPGNQVTLVANQFSGPIPHPAILREYESLCPGSAQRLIDQSLIESEHRRVLEVHALSAEITNTTYDLKNNRLGLFLAFGLGLSIVALAGYMVSVGAAEWAAAVLGAVLAGGVASFIGKKDTPAPPANQ